MPSCGPRGLQPCRFSNHPYLTHCWLLGQAPPSWMNTPVSGNQLGGKPARLRPSCTTPGLDTPAAIWWVCNSLNRPSTLVAEGIHQAHLARGGRSSGSAGNRRVEMNCSRRSTSCLKRLGDSLTQTWKLVTISSLAPSCTNLYPQIYICTKINTYASREQ